MVKWDTTQEWDQNTSEDGITHSGIDDHAFGSVQKGYSYGSLIEQLQAYYPCDDDGSTGTLTDSALSNDGTINGDTSYTTNSQIGSHALSFDGSGDYVSLPSFSQFSAYTIAVWSYHNSVSDGNEDRVITLEDNNYISLADDGASTFVMSHTSGGTTNTLSTGVSNGAWNHWALRWDGSTIAGFKNGNRFNSTTVSGIDANSVGDAIGSNGDGSSLYLDGRADEIRIFERSLSDSEIEALFNLSVPSIIQDGDLT